MHGLLRTLLFLIITVFAAYAQEGLAPEHPMDALTPEEIGRVVKIMRDAKLVNDAIPRHHLARNAED